MNPLFQVGEKVRLISRSHPEYNGEYFVERVFASYEECRYTDRLSGKSFWGTNSVNAYLLDTPLQDKGVNFIRECVWLESALRKIYPPSTESFDEMMRNIKQGKIIDNLVEELV